MRILVYGAGAVGGYLGGRLSQHGHEVTLVTRPVTAQFINEQGLDITEKGQTVRTQPTAVTSIAQAFAEGQAYDLLLMSMKSYDLQIALDHLVAFCPDPPPIITTGNGIDIELPLVMQFGAEKITAGSVTTPIRKETSYHLIVEKEGRGLMLAAMQPKQKIKEWVNLFRKSGVQTATAKSYESMKWSKALLNMVGNASSAILNRRPGLIYSSDRMYDLEVRMLQEALDVMAARKIKVVDLPGSSAKKLAFGVRRMPRSVLKPMLTKRVTSGRGNKMPSFYIDLAEGKGKTEVIYHNGAVAYHGQKLGIPTPVNAAYNDVLVKITNGELDWREFDGRPQRLAQEVRRYEAAMSQSR
ncbi:MAG TPA: ketopantoate reductase family protein [Anaerolineae bacterium]|nr:ketopantoate reductase family protein [Anaerolineae bacterium]